MPAKDLGAKHACYKCGTKFYDLKKPTPICPKCGADQRESPALKAPPSQAERRRARAPAEPEAEEIAGSDAEPEEPAEEEAGDLPDDDE